MSELATTVEGVVGPKGYLTRPLNGLDDKAFVSLVNGLAGMTGVEVADVAFDADEARRWVKFRAANRTWAATLGEPGRLDLDPLLAVFNGCLALKNAPARLQEFSDDEVLGVVCATEPQALALRRAGVMGMPRLGVVGFAHSGAQPQKPLDKAYPPAAAARLRALCLMFGVDEKLLIKWLEAEIGDDELGEIQATELDELLRAANQK